MNLFRVFCALIVMVSHLRIFPNTGLENEIFSVGAIGVDFFFILSGFSMAGMIEKYKKQKKFPILFLTNRLIRVVVPYIIATFLYMIVSNQTYKIDEIYKSILFLNNYSQEFKVFGLPLLPPGWSINYEVLFYLSLTVALVCKNINRFPFILFLLVLTNVFVPVSFIWLELIAGFYIFYYSNKINSILSSNIYLFIFIGIVCCIFIFINRKIAGDFISYQRILYWGFPATVLFILVQYYRGIFSFFDEYTIFNVSYSIYLTHWIVLVFNSKNNNFSILNLYAELFFIPVIYYIIIEHPCHKLSKNLFRFSRGVNKFF